MKKLALIHTVTSLVSVFKDLFSELNFKIDMFNIVDESLLKNTIKEGIMSPITARRLVNYMISAEQAGAEAIMVTCSSVGEAVDMAKPLLNVPAFRVDQPMAERAINQGNRIGVAATLKTTLNPTLNLINKCAAKRGKRIELIPMLCEGAFEAVIQGDTDKHDNIVANGLKQLFSNSDVIVLAQASMARVAEKFSQEEKRVPILSSPRLAVQYLTSIFGSR